MFLYWCLTFDEGWVEPYPSPLETHLVAVGTPCFWVSESYTFKAFKVPDSRFPKNSILFKKIYDPQNHWKLTKTVKGAPNE